MPATMTPSPTTTANQIQSGGSLDCLDATRRMSASIDVPVDRVSRVIRVHERVPDSQAAAGPAFIKPNDAKPHTPGV